jgi:hypothetical protein
MSIYKRSKIYSDFDVTAPVSREAVAHIPPAARETTSGWAAVRKSNPVNVVLPRTRTWSDELPSHLRPINLLEQFPRIANLIAFDWNHPTMVCRHFDDLLIDRRGNRRGFPTAIRQELRALRDYYYLDILPGTRKAGP